MKKRLILLLALMLLLTGCGQEDASGGEAQQLIPKQTEAVGTEEPRQLNTVLFLESKGLRVDYVLTALNPYASYGEGAPAINSQGADALARWLRTENPLGKIEKFEEGLFALDEENPFYTGWIGDANAYTKNVRLMVTEEISNTGMLQQILPLFEAEYGYTVELVTVAEGQAYMAAPLGNADLILAPAPREGELMPEENYFRQIPGFSEKQIPVFYCPYVLCGPAEDPAGVREMTDENISLEDGKLLGALKLIGEKQCYFISRGDYSHVHQAERSLWETVPEGEWYFAANTGMGPCLTIAEEMGGYVISDKLTWWIYEGQDGIL